MSSCNKIHKSSVLQAETLHKNKARKLMSDSSALGPQMKHKKEVKNVQKSTLKKKRKRSLVAADDLTYAHCFSEASHMFDQDWNGSSIDEAVRSIMSEGGSMQPNGALFRPNAARKKKKNNQNSSSSIKMKRNKVSNDKNEACSSERNISASSPPVNAYGHYEDLSLQALSPAKKKQKKETATFMAQENKNQQNQNKDLSVEKCSSKETGKLTVIGCNGKLADMGNGSVIHNVQSSNDDFLRDNSVQSLVRKKKSATEKGSCPKVMEKTQAAAVMLNLHDPTSTSTDSAERKSNELKSNAASNLQAYINRNYSCKSFCKKLGKSWHGKEIEDWPTGSSVLHSPFNCAHLPNFISSDSDFLGRLKKELHALTFTFRNNDMYKFRQSGELPMTGACLELRQLLCGPVRDWLMSCTGIQLSEGIDLSASLYLHSDALLCHDDELEGRRIAFILYLTGQDETWLPQDGGTLDLFEGEPGLAGRVVRRLSPYHNTFAFFEVSPLSFHQVAEVLCPQKARLSLSGWFHGPPLEYPPRPPRPLKIFLAPGHVEEDVFFSWVSPVYLAESLQVSIRRQLERDSEIQLETFFVPEKFEELSLALRSVDAWSWAGPPTSAHYQVCETPAPAVVREFLTVLRSEAFFLVLAQLTGVALHRLAPPDRASVSISSDSDVSDGEDAHIEDDAADSEVDEPKVQTLKQVLKDHKKKRHLRGSDELEPNFSVGLDEKWKYDLGVNVLSKPARTDPAGPSSGSDTPAENKTKKKNLKKIKSKNNEIDKSSGEVSRNRNTPCKGDPSEESYASVFCSLRRLSHGCYSLLRDDDNEGQSAACGRVQVQQRTEGATEERKEKTKSNGDHGDQRNQNDVSKEKIAKKAEAVKPKKKNKDNKEEEIRGTKSCENNKDGEVEDDENFVLDVSLFCNVPEDWCESSGGYTAYVGENDQEQLLCVVPQNNSLALVYRDERTHCFMKHINAACRGASFHQIFCQYRERRCTVRPL